MEHFINLKTHTSYIYLWTTCNECVTSCPDIDIHTALNLLTCLPTWTEEINVSSDIGMKWGQNGRKLVNERLSGGSTEWKVSGSLTPQ